MSHNLFPPPSDFTGFILKHVSLKEDTQIMKFNKFWIIFSIILLS